MHENINENRIKNNIHSCLIKTITIIFLQRINRLNESSTERVQWMPIGEVLLGVGICLFAVVPLYDSIIV